MSTSSDVDGIEISTELRQLAAAYGVATEYVDQAGAPVQVRRDTVVAVLVAALIAGFKEGLLE